VSTSEVEALNRQLQAQRARVGALEDQVRLLCESTGVPCNLDAGEAPNDVRELVLAGKRMDAVKRYRELTGCDFATAQQMIDSI